MNGASDIQADGMLGAVASHGKGTSMHQYRVERGDSPAIIARKYGVSTGSLLAANPAKPAHAVAGTMTWRSLAIGETVNVPRRHGLHGEFGLGYTDAALNAARAVDAELTTQGCCGAGVAGSPLSNAIAAFKQAILSNPSDWGNAYDAATVIPGSHIDVSNTVCQIALSLSDLQAVLGSAMTYTGSGCFGAWVGAGNCPTTDQGTGCDKPDDKCNSTSVIDSVTRRCAPMCWDFSRPANGVCPPQPPPLPATIECPQGTVKAGQQVANILTDCGGVALPCPQGTVREGQPIGMDPTCGGQKPGVDKCPPGTIREGQDVGTDTACGGSSLPCAQGTVREGQAIAMDPLCGGPKQKPAKEQECPAGQIRQGGQCIKAPSGGGSGGSNAALVAGGLIVVGGIAATVFAMRKKRQ
jgi:hypothetical protein